MAAQHFLEAVQRNAVDVLGGKQHGHAGAGHALLDQLSRLVSLDRSAFAALADVDLSDVLDHPDLHRDGLQLFTGFFKDRFIRPAS